jgi:hypothetical protein
MESEWKIERTDAQRLRALQITCRSLKLEDLGLSSSSLRLLNHSFNNSRILLSRMKIPRYPPLRPIGPQCMISPLQRRTFASGSVNGQDLPQRDTESPEPPTVLIRKYTVEPDFVRPFGKRASHYGRLYAGFLSGRPSASGNTVARAVSALDSAEPPIKRRKKAHLVSEDALVKPFPVRPASTNRPADIQRKLAIIRSWDRQIQNRNLRDAVVETKSQPTDGAKSFEMSDVPPKARVEKPAKDKSDLPYDQQYVSRKGATKLNSISYKEFRRLLNQCHVVIHAVHKAWPEDGEFRSLDIFKTIDYELYVVKCIVSMTYGVAMARRDSRAYIYHFYLERLSIVSGQLSRAVAYANRIRFLVTGNMQLKQSLNVFVQSLVALRQEFTQQCLDVENFLGSVLSQMDDGEVTRMVRHIHARQEKAAWNRLNKADRKIFFEDKYPEDEIETKTEEQASQET